MNEKIADKIKRFADLPHVVEKRRQLRAMYYIAKTNGGELSFIHVPTLVETAGLKKTTIALLVTCWCPIKGTDFIPESIEKILLLPMDTYSSAGEYPKVRYPKLR